MSKLIKPQMVLLPMVTRALSILDGLKGKVYVVGGLPSFGYTYRDIDIIVTEEDDIKKVKQALFNYKGMIEITVSKLKPHMKIYLTVDNKWASGRKELGGANKSPFAKKFF